MASVLFSTFGTALAGPLGGAIGSLVGGQADSLLFGRRGGALAERRAQSSAYGDSFPYVHGRIRQPGILIWHSELRTSGGGKGGTARSNALVASLAVAVSSRPIVRIGRIWADGREFRNESGEFSIPTVMRIYTGAELQRPDPVIEAVEGIGNCPAYRGLAYVVFEDLNLSSFGNRIPNFSFEVIADESGSIIDWIVDMAEAAGVELAVQDDAMPILGHAAFGPDWENEVSGLSRALLCRLAPATVTLHEAGPTGPLLPRRIAIEDKDCLAQWLHEPERTDRRRSLEAGEIGRWSVGYLDPDRDYAAGNQQYWSVGRGSEGRTTRVMAATAAQARAIAREQLLQRRAMAERVEFWLPWRWLELRPGDVVQRGTSGCSWRVDRVELGHVGVRVEGRLELTRAAGAAVPAEPGRGSSRPARPAPMTSVFVFEAPAPIADEVQQLLHILPTGAAGWRGAEVAWYPPGSPDGHLLGLFGQPVAFGILAASIPAGLNGLWNLGVPLDLVLADPAMPLEGRTALAVLQGANLLLVGRELIQFSEAKLLGAGRVRVERLLRGQAGTLSVSHPAGEAWCFVNRMGTARVPLSADWVGGTIAVEARGAGDPSPGTSASVVVEGAGYAPLAPCHVQVRAQANGAIDVSWIGRSREFFAWPVEEKTSPQTFRIWLWAGDTTTTAAGAISAVVYGWGHRFAPELVHQVVAIRPGVATVQVEALGAGPAVLRQSRPVHVQID